MDLVVHPQKSNLWTQGLQWSTKSKQDQQLETNLSFIHIPRLSFISLTFPNFFLYILCRENDWILLAFIRLQNGQSSPHESSPPLDFKKIPRISKNKSHHGAITWGTRSLESQVQGWFGICNVRWPSPLSKISYESRTIQYRNANISCTSKLLLFGSVRFGSPLPPKIAILGSVELGLSLAGLPCEVTGQFGGLNQEQTATVPDHCKATKDSANSCNENRLFKQLLRNPILHSSHNYPSMTAHPSILAWKRKQKGKSWCWGHWEG